MAHNMISLRCRLFYAQREALLSDEKESESSVDNYFILNKENK